MRNRYRAFRRKTGIFYLFDAELKRQSSLKTSDSAAAATIVAAKNEAVRQPALNLQIARAYLSGSDSKMVSRTWNEVFSAIVATKTGPTKLRWQRAEKETAFDSIRSLPLLKTTADDFLHVLQLGTVSTNVHLRKLHNFALKANLLPWPVLAKSLWPQVEFAEKRAITAEEHQKIVEREGNPENKAFYQVLWHLGGAQTDIENLQASSIDWQTRAVVFSRGKTKVRCEITFGRELEVVLKQLPALGYLFPRLQKLRESVRGDLFRFGNFRMVISSVTLNVNRKSSGTWAAKPSRYLGDGNW